MRTKRLYDYKTVLVIKVIIEPYGHHEPFMFGPKKMITVP